MKIKFPKKSTISATAVNAFVMCLCFYAANTRCGFLLHEPQMPAEVKKFKRF